MTVKRGIEDKNTKTSVGVNEEAQVLDMYRHWAMHER
jgi:hypothetical protein